MRDGIRWALVSGLLLLAACADLGPPDDPPARALRIAWLSYAQDGTLIAASRERIVRLDGALNELDRIVPPFPFDPQVSPPGLQFFGASRDGRVVAISWQSDSHDEPVNLGSGAIVFEIPSATLLRSDSYPGADTNFQGLSLSPDGLATAAVDGLGRVQVAEVTGEPRWQTLSGWLHPPLFTADSSMLVVGESPTLLGVRRAADGVPMFSLPATGYVGGMVGVSADGLTLAAPGQETGKDQVAIWRLSVDTNPLRTLATPADLAAAYPYAIALSPDGWQNAGGGMVALSYVPGGPDSLVLWRGDQLLYRHDGDTVWSVAFSPDGATLAAASTKRGVQLLRASDGTVIAERQLPLDDL